MTFRTRLLGIAVSGCMVLLAADPAAAAAGSYIRPTVNGIAVDNCATWGSDCGQGGANQFCRTQGYTMAQAFTLYRPGRTYVLGSQQICQGGFCVGLDQVTCVDAGGGAGQITYQYPQIGGSAVDNCATWGTNCGQAGADQYCRVAGRSRATAFQLYRPGRTYVIGSQRTCEGGHCVGFSQITCEATTTAITPVTPAITPPITPAQPQPPANTVRADWFTTADPNMPNGQRASYLCPPLPANGHYGALYGFEIYHYDSGICAAGAQVGTITLARGGVVTIELQPGLSSYRSGRQNDIGSSSSGAYSRSFMVVR